MYMSTQQHHTYSSLITHIPHAHGSLGLANTSNQVHRDECSSWRGAAGKLSSALHHISLRLAPQCSSRIHISTRAHLPGPDWELEQHACMQVTALRSGFFQPEINKFSQQIATNKEAKPCSAGKLNNSVQSQKFSAAPCSALPSLAKRAQVPVLRHPTSSLQMVWYRPR